MSQLAIPPAPRAVRVGQVPGLFRRVFVVAGLAFGLTLAIWALASFATRWLSHERSFLRTARSIDGTVVSVDLPAVDARDHASAKVRVLYRLDDADRSATVTMPALEAEGLGRGANIGLLVDPERPDHPREAHDAQSLGPWLWVANLLVGLGVLVSLALTAFELRRTFRREIDPLRTGAIVWLTPSEQVPSGRAPKAVVFAASYYRNDVRHDVTASASAGSWVRQGDRVLAALVPGQRSWVRVIDEELARRLGWYR